MEEIFVICNLERTYSMLSRDYLDPISRVDTEEELAVIGHYEQAEVAGKIYSIGECVLVFVSTFI